MSRQIPIFVEPGYEKTFSASRRSSEPASGDTRHHRHPRFNETDRIQEEFEDASNRFFEKNFRRRHTDFPDHTYRERDFRSDSPPRYQEKPFRRGSNPSSDFLPRRRAHFDEMIQRMMREDSDSFDFWDPQFGNFHVERTGRRHSPEDARKRHEKVTKSPSAPVSKERNEGKFDRQSSSPSTGSTYTADGEGFADIPVVVCKDDTTKSKLEKEEREKTETEEAKGECVTQDNDKAEVNSEGIGNEKDEKVKESEDDSNLTVKISVDTAEEKSDKDEEGGAKIDEDVKGKNVESQENVESVKSTNEQGNQMPQESQQNAQMPQESQQNAQIPQESQQNAQMPKESQQNAEIPQGQRDAQLSKIKSIEDELHEVAEKVKVFKPNGSTENNKEYLWLEEMLMRILMGLDAIEANGNKEIREARKKVVKQVQVALNELEQKSVPSAKNKS